MLVFKKTEATVSFNPILYDFPFMPGPAEYAIYASSSQRLAPYLPKVFLADELEPGVSYAFLLEQIGDGYRKPSKRDALAIVHHVGEFHAALAGHVGEEHRHLLVDHLAMEAELPDFYRRRLQEYFADTGDRLIGRVLKTFDRVETVYRNRKTFPEVTGVVHGDLNLANLRVPTHGEEVPKLFDWEWAGIHVLHTDLASVLKFVDPVVEHESISLYAELHPQVPPDVHRRLYYWCKLDRSLLDVVMMINLTNMPASRRLDVATFLHRSTRAAMHAYSHLTQ